MSKQALTEIPAATKNKKVVSGKTVNDAINKGLQEWGVTAEDVVITVLQQPSKGWFGLFGVKKAKVEMELRLPPSEPEPAPAPEMAKDQVRGKRSGEEAVEAAKSFLLDVLNEMGIRASIEQHESDGMLVFEISGNDLGMVIGRRGQTLDALQTIVNVYVNRISRDHLRILLDAEKFRERRKKTLQDLSLRLANQVVRTRKEVVLEPMPANERRIIHYQLQHHPKVKTISRGEEPNRRIVITLK